MNSCVGVASTYMGLAKATATRDCCSFSIVPGSLPARRTALWKGWKETKIPRVRHQCLALSCADGYHSAEVETRQLAGHVSRRLRRDGQDRVDDLLLRDVANGDVARRGDDLLASQVVDKGAGANAIHKWKALVAVASLFRIFQTLLAWGHECQQSAAKAAENWALSP